MENNVYRIKISSDICIVRRITKDIIVFLRQSIRLSDSDEYDIKLMLNELIINAIRHGNNDDPDKNVLVNIEIPVKGIISVTIKDEGTGFDYVGLLSKIKSEKERFSYSESGRGLQLVYSLADKVTFNSSGNEIIFIKKVAY